MVIETLGAISTPMKIGNLQIYGYRLIRDGSYRMSERDAAAFIGLPVENARNFLNSKSQKIVLGENFNCGVLMTDIDFEPLHSDGWQRTWRLEIVAAYWLWQAISDNKAALNMAFPLLLESLKQLFDAAFVIADTEEEQEKRNKRLIKQREEYNELWRLGLLENERLVDGEWVFFERPQLSKLYWQRMWKTGWQRMGNTGKSVSDEEPTING